LSQQNAGLADPLSLADIHIDLLYERDASGCLLRSRDPDVRSPLLHLVRTAAGNRWCLAASLAQPRLDALESMLQDEPVVPDLWLLRATPPILEGVRELLAGLTTAPVQSSGPVFAFPRLAASIATDVVTDAAALATAPELSWLRDAPRQAGPLVVARDDKGLVVSVCHSARTTLVAAEAGVETAPAYRGRGLATAVTARWAAEVIVQGRVPIYSTSWKNLASRGVARRLGLVMFGEDYALG
jgi:hypothetical protein